MSKKFLICLALGVMVMYFGACTQNEAANANTAGMTTTRTLADGSEITTTTDANGVTTETRVFRNNPQVSRVVVTTRDGRKTVRVFSPKGEEKEIDNVADALEVSGEKLADAAGFVADKAEDIGDETADKAEDVADQTVKGAKTVGKKTAQGAKKAGKAIKDAVTP